MRFNSAWMRVCLERQWWIVCISSRLKVDVTPPPTLRMKSSVYWNTGSYLPAWNYLCIAFANFSILFRALPFSPPPPILQIVCVCVCAGLFKITTLESVFSQECGSLYAQAPPRWPSGKASASRAEDPGFESRLRWDFSGVESYQWLKDLHSGGYPPGAWHYRVSTGTGRSGVSILWLGEVGSWICNFYLSVAAHKIVWSGPSLRCTSLLLGR